MSRVPSRPSEIFELSAESGPAYLARRGVTRPDERVRCRELGGGVSNTVVLVETGSERFILKQALPQLRVQAEWLADRSRAIRERNALCDAGRLLPKGWTPRVLWSDDDNFLYAMEAAEEPHEFWKNHLLAGRIDPHFARRAGMALGLTIRGSWRSERFEQVYRDRTAFDQLRTDPYYRVIGERNPDIADAVAEWLPETAGWRVALVHGDWSPKNMIVTPGGMVFIDYECAHFGDPSFDAGFCLNHFLLKSFYRPALAESYLRLGRVFFTWTLAVLPVEALRDFERMTARHLGFLLLARVDGKSPAEYITDQRTKDEIRETAKTMICERTETVEGCLAIVSRAVRGT